MLDPRVSSDLLAEVFTLAAFMQTTCAPPAVLRWPFPQDMSDGRRRVVAVRTLGLTVASCGNVMTPYLDFPQLLSVLLRMLHEGSQPQRREVIKVGVAPTASRDGRGTGSMQGQEGCV